MRDALGRMQRVVLVGMEAAPALELVTRWAQQRPRLQVVLAAQKGPARDGVVDTLSSADAKVRVLDLDLTAELDAHSATLAAAYAGPDVDAILLALGPPQPPEDTDDPLDADLLAPALTAYAGLPLLHLTTAARTLRAQGHGLLLWFDSAASPALGFGPPGDPLPAAADAGGAVYLQRLDALLARHGVDVLAVPAADADRDVARIVDQLEHAIRPGHEVGDVFPGPGLSTRLRTTWRTLKAAVPGRED